MKLYVSRLRTTKDEDLESRPNRDLKEDVVVEYNSHPLWKMFLRSEAESQCDQLRRMNIHVGLHHCEFAIEDLPENQFAIVCITHPTDAA